MAEAGSDFKSQVEDIVRCSLCLDVLTKPKTLRCFHSFCSHCLDGLAINTKSKTNDYECPQCRQITAKIDVRENYLVTQLLSAYEDSNPKALEQKCHCCESKAALWRCLDCSDKLYYCDDCKSWHDKIVLHQVVSLEEMGTSQIILGSTVFCNEHRKNEINVFCTECEKALCVLCKIFSHDGHKAIPITDALHQLLPRIEEGIKKIEANITMKENDLKLLGEEKDTTLQEFELMKKAALKECDLKKEITESSIVEQQQVIRWASTSQTHMCGIVLLTQIKDGLLSRIETLALDTGFIPGVRRMHATRRLPWTIKPLTIGGKMNIKLEISPRQDSSGFNQGMHVNTKTAQHYKRICVVWNQIWVFDCSSNTALRYTQEGTALEPLSFTFDGLRCAVQTDVKSAILCAATGLYLITDKGEVEKILDLQDFSDVCLPQSGDLYALDYKKGNVVHFGRMGNLWKRLKQIPLNNFHNGTLDDTFLVRDDSATVCNSHSGRIWSYRYTGDQFHQQLKFPTGYELGIEGTKSIFCMDELGRPLVVTRKVPTPQTKGGFTFVANQQQQSYLKESSICMVHDNDTTTTVLECGDFALCAAFQDEHTLWVLCENNSLFRYTVA